MTNGEKKAARTAVEKLLKEINGALVKREKGTARAVKHILVRAKKMTALHLISVGTIGEKALQRIDGGAS